MMDFKKEAARKKAEQTSTRIAQMNLQLSKQKAQADIAYESKNIVRDLANAYISIYEKKVDQDGDGDTDFADVMIARMVAAGVPKEKAIAMTKNKSYNKEEYSDYEIVASYLLEYNFAETLEDADRIIENMSDNWITQILDEAREPGVKAYRPNPTQAEVRADAAAARRRHVESGKGKFGYGPEEKFKSDWKLRVTPASTLKKKDGGTETVSQRMDREKPYATRMTGPLAREYGSRTAAEVTRTVRGPGEPQAVTMPRKSGSSKEIVRKPKSDD